MTTYTKITISGVEISPDMLAVTKSLGDIDSTSKFTARLNNYSGRNTGSFTIGDEVKIYCDKDINPPTTQIFLGILEDTNLNGKEEYEKLTFTGRDYSARMIDRTVEPEVYTNLPAGSIIKDIIAKYTDDITTTNVSDGTTVNRIAFNQVPVFDAVRQLANMQNYMFYIDNNKDLHFKEKATASSGYTFDNTNIIESSFKEKRTEIFNEIWVYGDRYLDGYQETFSGTGTGSVFTLGYNPHNTNITVDSAIVQPGGIYQMTYGVGSAVKYLVNYDDKAIVFTSGTEQGDNIPGAGSSIVVTYMRDLPIVKFGDNDASVATYGKRVKVIQDKSIKDPITAETILLRELDKWSDPLKQGEIQVRNVSNVTPGETCIVNFPYYDISNVTYDMVEAKYDFTKQSLLSDNVLKIRLNKKIPDITDTLKKIILEQKKVQSQDATTTDLLTRYKFSAGSFSIRQSGLEVWTQGIGSSFILGHTTNGLLGSYTSHTLGDWRTGSTFQWSGGYF